VLVQVGLEVLFPMPFVKDQRSLRTALFWDVGSVYNTNCSSSQENGIPGRRGKDPSCELDYDNLASSVGVGLTWITAMGPLSFSLAMPIKKPADAETEVFQFSLGQTF